MPVIKLCQYEIIYRLNPQERYAFYILFREWLKEELDYTNLKGFCQAIYSFIESLNHEIPVRYCSIVDLPELWELRPPVYYHEGGYWFKPGKWKPRLKLLDKAISELEIELYASNK